jgi:DNA-binding CsgD family transcriptional regulator/PAS domain-containing protein
MVTVDEFSRLVSGIYAAAVTPQDWDAALGDVRRSMGATHSGLFVPDGVSRSIIGATVPAEDGTSYVEYYHRLDYVLAAMERGPVGAVRTGLELMNPRTRREFHGDWLRRIDVDDGLFVRLTDGPRPTCLVVGGLRGTESFDTPDRVKLVGGLVPHLQQALRAQSNLTALTQSNTDLVGALEAVRHGIIIVGPDWWVINLNTAAERILRAEDGLQMRSTTIAATSMPADRKLQRALHDALNHDGSRVRGGLSFVCERPSGKRPYVVHVLPLHHTDETPSEARALVLITDADQEPEPAPALLRRLYGLTTTEADVAVRIARGADPKEISDEFSVSITTVRKHLQHVFDKTDTHRQAELVRLLLTLRP